jgi:hypothetical protein
MKNLLIIVAISLLPCMAMAQDTPVAASLTDTTLNLAREQYCIITPRGKLFSDKITLDVDYGQKTSYEQDNGLFDADGKEIYFNSLADGLNFMARRGWLYVNTIPAREQYTSYLLRRALPLTVSDASVAK